MQSENRFTLLIHRRNVFLETLRGGIGAELTTGTDINGNSASDDRTSYSRNEGSGLSRTDASGFRFRGNAGIADVDIAAASGKVKAGAKSYSDVASASGVLEKRFETFRRIGGSSCVIIERIESHTSIVATRVLWRRVPAPKAVL